MATKRYNFKFHCLKDKDIIDRIDSQENKQNYIRGLILSDIAADILRDSIKLEEQDPDPDPEENEYNDRIDFYNDHCPALNNLDPSKNHCDGCEYKVHFTDVDGIEKAACSLEDAWRTYCANVIDNMMEVKSDGKIQQS